ncbi:MAG: DUF1343 domain-containing protein [Bacteroidales bacterium]
MKKTSLNIALFLIFAFSLYSPLSGQVVKTGIEVLKEENFETLAGKRVGLITNPSGVDFDLKSSADLFYESDRFELVALFGPEHGVRGNLHAGESGSNSIDPQTGVTLYSLYGATRKPTPKMLEGIDILVYDIQDIGCRSYTFISTMGLAMEACAQAGIEFVVLDRPNPLGGVKVEGPLPQDGFLSFVGQYKIPYIYGLSCGELALYINGTLPPQERCNLKVVKMEGWNRSMSYRETGLEWIPPSPHIPTPESALFYPASGILGELGFISIGIGYTLPFQLFGAEWIESQKLAEKLNSYNLEGVYFRAVEYKPFYGFGSGKVLEGVQPHIVDFSKVALTELQFRVLEALNELYPRREPFGNLSAQKRAMFDKVTGSSSARELLSKGREEGGSFDIFFDFWRKDIENFKEISHPYLLYPHSNLF